MKIHVWLSVATFGAAVAFLLHRTNKLLNHVEAQSKAIEELRVQMEETRSLCFDLALELENIRARDADLAEAEGYDERRKLGWWHERLKDLEHPN